MAYSAWTTPENKPQTSGFVLQDVRLWEFPDEIKKSRWRFRQPSFCQRFEDTFLDAWEIPVLFDRAQYQHLYEVEIYQLYPWKQEPDNSLAIRATAAPTSIHIFRSPQHRGGSIHGCLIWRGLCNQDQYPNNKPKYSGWNYFPQLQCGLRG